MELSVEVDGSWSAQSELAWKNKMRIANRIPTIESQMAEVHQQGKDIDLDFLLRAIVLISSQESVQEHNLRSLASALSVLSVREIEAMITDARQRLQEIATRYAGRTLSLIDERTKQFETSPSELRVAEIMHTCTYKSTDETVHYYSPIKLAVALQVLCWAVEHPGELFWMPWTTM